MTRFVPCRYTLLLLMVIQLAAWGQPDPPTSSEREASFLFRQGIELLESDESERALELFSKALQLEPERIEILPYYGQSLFEAQKYQLALEQLERYLKQEPEDSKAAFLRARVLTALGRYGQALDALDLLTVSMGERSWQWLNLKGFLEEGRANYAKAEESYQKAARLATGTFEPQTNLVALYLKQGKTEEAQAIIDELLTLAPDNPQVLNALALVLAKKDASFNPSLLLDKLQDRPLAFELQYNLAASLAQAQPGNYAAAAILAGDLVDRYPDDARASFLYGRILLQQGELKDAGQFLLAARDRLEQSVELVATMGVYSYRTGNYADAASWFKLATQAEPQEAQWKHDLSLVLSHLDRLDEALKLSLEAKSLHPNDAQILYQLALVYERMGKRQEAAGEYKRFLEVEPGSERAAAVKERLKELGFNS